MHIKLHKTISLTNQWSYGLFCLCLLLDLTLSDNQGMQRRFMWKQMEGTMDGIMNGVSSGTRAVKDMIGEFLPLVQTTPNTDFAATSTTRIKYIIKKPAPMKIIKIRSPHKITKIIKMPPTIHQPNKVNYKTESLNKVNNNNNDNNNNNKKYHALETAAEALASGRQFKQHELIKPSAMSKLHTNIMLDASGTTLGKVVTAEPIYNEHDYTFAASNKNGYEVVEHIDEDNIDYNRIIFPTVLPYSNTLQDTESKTETTTEASSPVFTLTTKKMKKLVDSRLLSTVNTIELSDNPWQPSFGYETSTKPSLAATAATFKPKGFWRTEKLPLLQNENENIEIESSIATIIDNKQRGKKRTKNMPARQKKTQEEIQKNHQHQQQQQQQQKPHHEPYKQQIDNKSKQKRGSIKFGDKIN